VRSPGRPRRPGSLGEAKALKGKISARVTNAKGERRRSDWSTQSTASHQGGVRHKNNGGHKEVISVEEAGGVNKGKGGEADQ